MLLRNLLLVLAALAGLSIRKHNHKSYIRMYGNTPIAGPYNLPGQNNRGPIHLPGPDLLSLRYPAVPTITAG